MAAAVVVDSGPLLALFDRDDFYHKCAVAWLSRFSGRLLSNAAVVTEVAHLLDFSAVRKLNSCVGSATVESLLSS